MFRFAMGHDVTRRKFLGVTLTGGVTILAGGLPRLVTAAAATKSTFQLGGDVTVDRLGVGAMRLTGAGVWGWAPDREKAKKVLRGATELGVNLIDTAGAY